MNIQPIVEGDGEVSAVPVLLRRLRDAAGAYSLGVNAPIRRARTDLVREDGVRKAVRLARLQQDCAAILIMFDSDDDCPKEIAPLIQAWAQTESSPIPCFVVIPTREYEAWFLATVESLRGVRGILADATSHAAPESPRGAAEELRKRMTPNRSVFQARRSACTHRSVRHGHGLSTLPILQAYGESLRVAGRRCRDHHREVAAIGMDDLVSSSLERSPSSVQYRSRPFPSPNPPGSSPNPDAEVRASP